MEDAHGNELDKSVYTELHISNDIGKFGFFTDKVVLLNDFDEPTALEFDFEKLKNAVDEHSKKLEAHKKYNGFKNWLESIKRKS